VNIYNELISNILTNKTFSLTDRILTTLESFPEEKIDEFVFVPHKASCCVSTPVRLSLSLNDLRAYVADSLSAEIIRSVEVELERLDSIENISLLIEGVTFSFVKALDGLVFTCYYSLVIHTDETNSDN